MKIAVIGVGTAGVMSLCHALKWLCPDGSTITSIYNPDIKILSVGETMDPGFVTMLFNATRFTYVKDGHELDAMIKLGVGWKGWREEDFVINMAASQYTINFNNGKLKDFCFKRFDEHFGDKFKRLEGTVNDVKTLPEKAVVTVDGVEHDFDYVVDCRGYPEDYSEYNIVECPVNHVLVHQNPIPGTSYTPLVQAHKNGWMFHIPLTTREAWGYLYNDEITSKEEAIKDIHDIFGRTDMKLNEFSFKSYYAKEFFDGRVIKNGNRALFFEPIEGLAGYFYLLVMRGLVDYITDGASRETLNNALTESARFNEMFINYAYHGGSNYDSEFWRITKEKTTKILYDKFDWDNVRKEVKEHIDKHGIATQEGCYGWSTYHWIEWEKHMKFNYFKD
jgi:hypothetical protein